MLTANLPFEVMNKFETLIRPVDPDRDYFISVHTETVDRAFTPIKKNTLYVAFGDTVSIAEDMFTHKQAKQIARFILNVRATGGNLWVNCWAGISRSGAIVDTLIKLGWRDLQHPLQERRIPNPLVEAALLKQFTELKDVSPKYSNAQWGNEIYTLFYGKKYAHLHQGSGAPQLVTME